MNFPSSPVNGQQATVNNVVYVYDSAKDTWTRSGTISSTLIANAIIINSGANSNSATTGAIQVAGGMGIAGNLFVGDNLIVGNVDVFANFNATIGTVESIVAAGNANVAAGIVTTQNIVNAGNANVAAGIVTTQNIVNAGNANVAAGIVTTQNIVDAGNAAVAAAIASVDITSGRALSINFGNTPAYTKVAYIAEPTANIGDKVIVTPTAFTTNTYAQLGNDEFEFDNFMCVANVIAAGNIAVYITSYPGPVKGERNFDYVIGG
jgi:hypothetical protein